MCKDCMYLVYDEEMKDYVCEATVAMDEDDYYDSYYGSGYRKKCPYYKVGDEYDLVKKQN